MATWSRRERVTRTVEYTVPCHGDGATYAEVQKAITAAHMDLTTAGRADSFGTVPDNEIRVLPGDDEILVVYTTDEIRGRQSVDAPPPYYGWSLWYPHGGLAKFDDAEHVGDNVAAAWALLGATTGIPVSRLQAEGWRLAPVTEREFAFLSRPGMAKALARDGSWDAWVALVARDAQKHGAAG